MGLLCLKRMLLLLIESFHFFLEKRRGNRMAVRDVIRQLSEAANLTVPHEEVVEALRRMEANGAIQFNERAQTIFVRTGIVSG